MKKTKKILVIAVLMVLLGSWLGGMFNTSMYSVSVKKIEFETERGTLSALLYMPKGAGEESKRPVIVTTHGYLNSKEMQDAPAIEMSRRGYIVLALDMYDHGDSRWEDHFEVGEQFSTFWIYSQLDAANYAAQQDYTLKDDNGNAYVAVSGHSMGGFSSLVALYMDEMASLQRGTRNIYTGISVGADYSYASAIASEQDYIAAFGDRTVGMIAGHYDEFFFGKSDDEKTEEEKAVNGTVTYKDFAATASGKMFLGVGDQTESAESEKFYTVESGELVYDGNVVRESQTGQHIIYTPNQTHPWNHFSKTTTGNLIDFYQTAFADAVTADMTNADLSSGNQIWFWKEFFNLIALIGFFLMIVPIVTLLLKAPFLRNSVTEEIDVVRVPQTAFGKSGFWIMVVCSILYPAVFFSTLMDKSASGLKILAVGGGVICAVNLILAVLYFMKKEKGRGTAMIAGAVVSLLAVLNFTLADKVIPLNGSFCEPTTNQIAYWAVSCGLIALIILFMFYGISRKNLGTKAKDYGVRLKGKTIAASFVTALAAVVIVYIVLFVVQAAFGVDFRIWVLAVRTFKPEFLVTALCYLPFFFIYYLINTTALNANCRKRKNGYLIAVLMNIGGLVIWLALQYGLDFARGVSLQPTQALNGILLFALVPCLGIAAVFARRVFDKTNNVWLASFLNTFLFTMISVANTAMFWNMG
ncbi:esterase [uncultured Roseburia sp.]|uniref:Serine aminopeptidase S33 domain-containing protein n=1 Tax=Brotonthovivens ammoniilytica TaxID=2981725 RepID=A0ABT2TM69_9FIRM|nr:hypothetical protein [Brotonthovivens ammoniilytica]MCU6763315.1 hypothetical protein [Brotonthovivens ammoniilytica]SCJ13049.1 esterase [uncultured Roseburia sp.]